MAISRHLSHKDATFAASSWVAQRRSMLAMWVFLASLAMFFASCVVLYLVARFVLVTGSKPVPVPPLFVASTVVLLGGGFCVQRSLAMVRLERQREFRTYLTVASLLGIAFCVLQGLGLDDLLAQHFALLTESRSPMSGVLFVMILLHVLHFGVGLGVQFFVNVRALQGRYDHEFYPGVRLCAIYWRFLDVVWLLMYGLFLLTT